MNISGGNRSWFLVALAILVIAPIRFLNAAICHGPDADDVLIPMCFDLSRATGSNGIFTGMYNFGFVAGLSFGKPQFQPILSFLFQLVGSDASILDTLDRLKIVFFVHIFIYGTGIYLFARSIGLRTQRYSWWASFLIPAQCSSVTTA